MATKQTTIANRDMVQYIGQRNLARSIMDHYLEQPILIKLLIS